MNMTEKSVGVVAADAEAVKSKISNEETKAKKSQQKKFFSIWLPKHAPFLSGAGVTTKYLRKWKLI